LPADDDDRDRSTGVRRRKGERLKLGGVGERDVVAKDLNVDGTRLQLVDHHIVGLAVDKVPNLDGAST